MPEIEAAAFAFEIRAWVWVIVSYGASLLSLIALVHCAVQKSEAFNAVNTLTKGTWVGILAIGFLVSLFFGGYGGLGLFGLIALCAALIYLLDVRTAIKDIGGSAY